MVLVCMVTFLFACAFCVMVFVFNVYLLELFNHVLMFTDA